jgi:hypothetical protein
LKRIGAAALIFVALYTASPALVDATAKCYRCGRGLSVAIAAIVHRRPFRQLKKDSDDDEIAPIDVESLA